MSEDFDLDIEAELARIEAMTDEDCRLAGIAEYGSEEAWRAAMAMLKAKLLACIKPTPDPAVMRDYIDRLTRFYIDNAEWVRLANEARGYIGALKEDAAVAGAEQVKP